jgi:hypothetical protein
MEGQQITYYDIGELCTAYETNNPSPLHETLVQNCMEFLALHLTTSMSNNPTE